MKHTKMQFYASALQLIKTNIPTDEIYVDLVAYRLALAMRFEKLQANPKGQPDILAQSCIEKESFTSPMPEQIKYVRQFCMQPMRIINQ